MSVSFRFVALLAVLPCLMAAEIVEKDEAGRIKAKYTVVNGKKNGPFVRYYDGEKVRAKGTYKSDRLDGEMLLFYADGKKLSKTEYKNGQLDGTVEDYDRDEMVVVSATYKKGELSTLQVFDGKTMIAQPFKGGDPRKSGDPRCPRRYAEIQEAWGLIDALPPPKGLKDDPADLDRIAALRRLQKYRAFVGIPYEGMALDAGLNKSAEAGAEIIQAIGRLDHNPPNPGWPEAKYKFALAATRSSNLDNSSVAVTREQSVDHYMDDSDASNIDCVGHRRWCLNPRMLNVDFGRSPDGRFSAMMALDSARKDFPAYDFVAYPPAGLAPPGFFKASYAWNISPNPEKYKPPFKNRVAISVLSRSEKDDTPLKLNSSNVSVEICGSGPAIIFRPENLDMSAGARYLVRIEGLETKDGRSPRIEYMVWFTQ
jgi:hypothetical protein